MVKFLLYRSGIHNITVMFDKDCVYYQEHNVRTNKWSSEQILTETKANKMESYYHINPLHIRERYQEFKRIFQTESEKIVTSWGAVYEKAPSSLLYSKPYEFKRNGLPKESILHGKLNHIEAKGSKKTDESLLHDKIIVGSSSHSIQNQNLENCDPKGNEEKNSPSIWVERMKKFPLDVIVFQGEPVAFISPSRENCSVFVKEGMEKYTPVALWENEIISKAIYSVRHLGSFMLKMRDGVRLSTDVWLPVHLQNKGPFPVILVRTPYGRMSFERDYVHFVQRGFGLVIQDTRGRQDSEGKWLPKFYEMEDGDDTLHWLKEQPWCDGNIGMIGASYSGYVQWAAAASRNPHLKALVSIVTAGSPFVDIPRKGGAFVSGMLAWTFAMAEKEFRPENMEQSDWDEILNHRPIQDIPKRALGREIDFWNKWMRHCKYDSFWEKSDWSKRKEKIQVPALIISGWYDDNGMGTTEALEIVADYKAEDRKVFLGPWMHQANTTRDIQGVELGNHSLRYDIDFYIQKWFDSKLKRIEHNLGPGVEYYVMGENRWKTAEQWPPGNLNQVNWYLGSGGNAKTAKGDGILTLDVTPEAGYDEFLYNPEYPAPHLIDMSDNEIGIPANYKDVEDRKDVLVYTSSPFEEPFTVVGDFTVTFFASSSARDTDWIVRITDVDLEGNSIKLADGVLRARFRKGFDREVFLEPGKIEKYEIRTSKVANTFKQGHRIRLTITSSAKNFIFPNSNTGNDPATDVDYVTALQRVFHGGKYPSKISTSACHQ